jgi:hypothetical protein
MTDIFPDQLVTDIIVEQRQISVFGVPQWLVLGAKHGYAWCVPQQFDGLFNANQLNDRIISILEFQISRWVEYSLTFSHDADKNGIIILLEIVEHFSEFALLSPLWIGL